MAEVRRHQCDYCKEETNDFAVEIGWISFAGTYLKIVNGTEDGHYVSNLGSIAQHFCSMSCFTKFFKKQYNNALKLKKKK